MSSSESDYDVEQYIKPTIKRSTYNNDDTYLSEGNETSEIEEGSAESEPECVKDNPNSEIILNPAENNCEIQKSLKVKDRTEIVKTNSRFILYISNLSSETTKSMIEDFFSDAGNLKSVRVPKKRLSNFAFVEMKDLESYKNGLKFDGKELDGKKIRVHQGTKNKKHISNKSKIQKKKKIQIFEKKFQNRIANKKI